MKKTAVIFLILAFIVSLAGCSENATTTSGVQENQIIITDDLGKTIALKAPAKRIISLYSAHTENLFALGLNEEIIGVGKHECYPPQVRHIPVFDYRSDPEKVIAVGPDLVVIRPFIQRSSPDFVKALEKAKINVVCLYPDKFEEFPVYITKLGRLTGKEKEAEELLNDFKKKLNEIESITKKISNKKKIFFESTETEYRTISTDSMAATAIRIAGGINIAKDARPVREGSSIASYGAEKILSKAGEIDIYIAQRGAMNPGGTPHAIRIRPGFDKIKAVKENKIYNIDEKLVSSPTFRFVTGVHELARIFYPEIFDDLSKYKNDKEITRKELAEMVVKFKHTQIFTPNWKYYKRVKPGRHIYGNFKDVKINDPYFNYIETAVSEGYIDYTDSYHYNPEKTVTRDELSKTVFMMFDINDKDVPLKINDLQKCKNKRIIEILCKNGIMSVDKNLNFMPELTVSGKEVLQTFEKASLICKRGG